jgi:uracil-DNA glycosylase
MSKESTLAALAKKRQATRWEGFSCIADYHDGVYECPFVSPYTKAAGFVDAEILVMLQDWSSDGRLRGPVDREAVRLGHTPTLATNRNLTRLLHSTFAVDLSDVYATNLFPFIKRGPMNGPIPHDDLVRAANDFGLPQIRIIEPKLVVCLGLATFNALREAAGGLALSNSLASAIESPFDLGKARVWCQAHTGAWGQYNRNRRTGVHVDFVSRDWQNMQTDFVRRRRAVEPVRRAAKRRCA